MNLCEIVNARKGLRKIRLDVEEILDEAQSDPDRDIIVTACKSILSEIEAMSTLPTFPWVKDGFSGTNLDWYCGYCEGRMTIGHTEDCPYASPE